MTTTEETDCEVIVHELTISPHPDADRLEVATFGGYQCVVAKGEHKTGDLAIYIPDQTFVPEHVLRDMGDFFWDSENNRGKLSRTNGQVAKPKTIRGILSEGLVYAPDMRMKEGQDVTKLFGFERWHPKLPSSFGGDALANADFVPWINIENIKKNPNGWWGRQVSVTAKIHGSAFCMTRTPDGEHLISSKGMGKKGIIIGESETNIYWKAYHKFGLGELIDDLFTVNKLALFGEVYGTQVNGFSYGLPPGELGFKLFDVASITDGENVWWDYPRIHNALLEHGYDHEMLVPEFYRGKFDHEKIRLIAEDPKPVFSDQDHINEGVVIRSTDHPYTVDYETVDGDGNPVTWSRTLDRQVAKYINPAYLERKGTATEYE